MSSNPIRGMEPTHQIFDETFDIKRKLYQPRTQWRLLDADDVVLGVTEDPNSLTLKFGREMGGVRVQHRMLYVEKEWTNE